MSPAIVQFSRVCIQRQLYRSAKNLSIRTMSTSDKPKVYVTRRIPESGLVLLREKCDISQWSSDDPVPRAELLANLKDKDALFCLLTDKVDKEVLDAGKQLKVIGTMSVGYDHLDLPEIAKRSIPIGYTPDVLTDATAELTVSLLLAASRRIPEGVDAVRSGEWGTWKPMWLCGATLVGSTVGIIGLGRIGLAVAKRLQPFGVSQFLYTGTSQKPCESEVNAQFLDFNSLLEKSDFVVVCCALTADTRNLFNESAFRRMKKSAIFVNTSRGGVVDQDALCNALTTGEIRAAGLDVTVPEPLPTDSPLLKLNNCVVIPHIGSATDETRSRMAELTAQNIIAGLEGRPMPAQIKV